ncbi:hypothetical protein V2E24_00990 [Mycoplasmopsis ciconiae]|uniref:Uncharacterized protein n=1 Tax=Mycoplasmopsis ciconiae TaxID=561067 RepID=A0ABU7MKV3_9BACT|nr:hypothetical protein [Mycoplasmopsis ciconiae]
MNNHDKLKSKFYKLKFATHISLAISLVNLVAEILLICVFVIFNKQNLKAEDLHPLSIKGAITTFSYILFYSFFFFGFFALVAVFIYKSAFWDVVNTNDLQQKFTHFKKMNTIINVFLFLGIFNVIFFLVALIILKVQQKQLQKNINLSQF